MAQQPAPAMAMIRGIALGAASVVLFGVAAGCGSQGGDARDAGPDGLGAVAVDAGVTVLVGPPFACPGIDSFSIDNAELTPDEVAHLDVRTVGPDASFLQWTVDPASAGIFSDASAPQATFRCAGPGSATVTVTVGVTAPGRGNVCKGVAFTSYASVVHCRP